MRHTSNSPRFAAVLAVIAAIALFAFTTSTPTQAKGGDPYPSSIVLDVGSITVEPASLESLVAVPKTALATIAISLNLQEAVPTALPPQKTTVARSRHQHSAKCLKRAHRAQARLSAPGMNVDFGAQAAANRLNFTLNHGSTFPTITDEVDTGFGRGL